MTASANDLPFTDPGAFAQALDTGAVQSMKLRGTWLHRRPVPRDSMPASIPLAPGESVLVNGRWFHGPQIGSGR